MPEVGDLQKKLLSSATQCSVNRLERSAEPELWEERPRPLRSVSRQSVPYSFAAGVIFGLAVIQPERRNPLAAVEPYAASWLLLLGTFQPFAASVALHPVPAHLPASQRRQHEPSIQIRRRDLLHSAITRSAAQTFLEC